METPYIVPQESGNRIGVTDIILKAPNEHIALRGTTPFNFSISRYTQENLLTAMHTNELLDTTLGKDAYYTLYIDAVQRGVGTATCGPDTLEKYRVYGSVYHIRIYIG
jgi:hypothetical protein